MMMMMMMMMIIKDNTILSDIKTSCD